MSKYENLTFHLANKDEDVWDASFEEIELVLGIPLPDSAHQYPAWWANQGRAQSLAWERAGWKTKAVDVKNFKVTFIYVGDQIDGEIPADRGVAQLSIADAKAGLAAAFGVSVDAVEITIRG